MNYYDRVDSSLYDMQGMVGFARKPVLISDTDVMLEINNHLAPNLNPFGAYVMPKVQKVFLYTKIIVVILVTFHYLNFS